MTDHAETLNAWGAGVRIYPHVNTAHGVLVRVRRVHGTWVRAGDEMASANKSSDPPDSPVGGARVGGTAGRKSRRSVIAQGCTGIS